MCTQVWPSCGLKLASPGVIDFKKEIGMYMRTVLSLECTRGPCCHWNVHGDRVVIGMYTGTVLSLECT